MRTDEGVCPYLWYYLRMQKALFRILIYGGAEAFELALDLIEDGCEGLMKASLNPLKEKGYSPNIAPK